MNSSLRNVLIFTAGVIVGSAATFFGVKKYFELKADLEVESVKKAYEEKIYETESHENTLDGTLEGPSVIDVSKERTTSSIVRELNNKPDLLDYTKYFKASGEKLSGVSETLRDAKEEADKEGLSEEELAEMEHPEDDEPYTDEEDEDQTLEFEDYQLNGAKKEAILSDKPPFEIAASDYELTCSHYEKMSLVYHAFDYVLTDDDDEEVDKILFVGNVIEETGFDEDNSDVLYVRNDKLQTDFEITKVFDESNVT